MANNMSLRQICHATRYVVAQGLCWLFWCLKYAVILPLATMALATPTTFLVNVNTLEALPLLQGATDAAGFMARMDTVLQMYGGKKGAK